MSQKNVNFFTSRFIHIFRLIDSLHKKNLIVYDDSLVYSDISHRCRSKSSEEKVNLFSNSNELKYLVLRKSQCQASLDLSCVDSIMLIDEQCQSRFADTLNDDTVKRIIGRVIRANSSSSSQDVSIYILGKKKVFF